MKMEVLDTLIRVVNCGLLNPDKAEKPITRRELSDILMDLRASLIDNERDELLQQYISGIKSLVKMKKALEGSSIQIINRDFDFCDSLLDVSEEYDVKFYKFKSGCTVRVCGDDYSFERF